jgi:repressor LexA
MTEKTLIDTDPRLNPRNEVDRRVLEVVAEILQANNIKNERQFLVAHRLNESLLYKIRRGIQSANEDLIKLLTSNYKVNANFVFSGMGPMFHANDGNASQVSGTEGAFSSLPFLPVRATATFVEQYDNDSEQTHKPDEVFSVTQELGKKYTKGIILEIHGDSMTPQLKNGAKVIAMPVAPEDYKYQLGVVAVIYRDYFVVKRINENRLPKNEPLELTSDNPKGGTMYVTLADIRAMWKVVKIIESDVE